MVYGPHARRCATSTKQIDGIYCNLRFGEIAHLCQSIQQDAPKCLCVCVCVYRRLCAQTREESRINVKSSAARQIQDEEVGAFREGEVRTILAGSSESREIISVILCPI